MFLIYSIWLICITFTTFCLLFFSRNGVSNNRVSCRNGGQPSAININGLPDPFSGRINQSTSLYSSQESLHRGNGTPLRPTSSTGKFQLSSQLLSILHKELIVKQLLSIHHNRLKNRSTKSYRLECGLFQASHIFFSCRFCQSWCWYPSVSKSFGNHQNLCQRVNTIDSLKFILGFRFRCG